MRIAEILLKNLKIKFFFQLYKHNMDHGHHDEAVLLDRFQQHCGVSLSKPCTIVFVHKLYCFVGEAESRFEQNCLLLAILINAFLRSHI